MTSRPLVSVIMPTFEQVAFLRSSVASLTRQSLNAWELIVVDDGSQDDTPLVFQALTRDGRVRYVRLARNRGLGAAVNTGLAMARAELIAYLPSDDLYDPGHLEVLRSCLDDEGAVLAWSGVRCGGTTHLGAPPRHGLQMVQVMHRRGSGRWKERTEIETPDLERLFWRTLRARGRAVATGRVTCDWVQHPAQRHRVMRESADGGLNVFRRRYRVREPLRFDSGDSTPVDEVALYSRFRHAPVGTRRPRGLRILLVGELAFNPERVLAFEERGHRLFGLWTQEGLGSHTVGPLPFGHVEDLPASDWRREIRRIAPDVIYALLNWRAVPLAHGVLNARLRIPFVWHFKESPMRCRARGTWSQLADLHAHADARIYATPLEAEWFEMALPGMADPGRTIVIDGDLPKADWFTRRPSERLSNRDGEVHTAGIGSPLGLDLATVRALAAEGIHIHLYGLVRSPGPRGRWTRWLDDARRAAPRYVHVHPHVDQRGWVTELSRYDAAWLHRFTSRNGGDLARASWDDLNYPARIPPLVAAGLPLLHQHSADARVAVQDLLAELEGGVLYGSLDELSTLLRDEAAMDARRRAIHAQRDRFTFDHHVDRLVDLFRAVAT